MTDLRLQPTENVRICGHRGDMCHAPENTLAALRMGHQRGAQACEIDIRLTADGQLVLLHDANLDRTTNGKGPVAERTLADVQSLDAGGWFGADFAGEPVPTLAAAVDLARELGLILRVELKDWHRNDALFPALVRVIGPLVDAPLVLCSFDHRQLLAVKQALPAIRTMGITHGRAADLVAMARSGELDGLSVQAPAMADDDIAALHAAGIAISCYCPMDGTHVDAQASLDKVRRWAAARMIDMITVDDVGWLRGELASEELRAPLQAMVYPKETSL